MATVRLNPDLGYEPGNVAWKTLSDQANNKRSTKKVVYEGELVPVTPLCRKLGLDAALVRRRLAEGKTGEEALVPSKSRKSPSDRSRDLPVG